MKRRYLISWTYMDTTGRDTWVMERRGKLSSADIKNLEVSLAEKWGISSPVIITNVVQIN